MKRPTAVIAVILLLSGVAPNQKVAPSQPEQQSFRIGQHRPVVKHPVPLSDAELVAIRKATPAEQGLEDLVSNKAAPSGPKPTREGLEAAVVHLNGSAERDLVVIGSGRRYAAGTAPYWIVAPFWVIREGRDGPKVVLAIFTSELRVLQTKHSGIADLTVHRDTGMGGLLTFLQLERDKYVVTAESMD